jgi:hypothetical protein
MCGGSAKNMKKLTLRFLLEGTGILLAGAILPQVAVTSVTTTTTLNRATTLCNVIENNIDKKLANFSDNQMNDMILGIK